MSLIIVGFILGCLMTSGLMKESCSIKRAGYKPDILATKASMTQPPSGGSNVLPPKRPKAFPLDTYY